MPITHAFVSPKSDGADTDQVQPSDWNADHIGAGGETGEELDYVEFTAPVNITATTEATADIIVTATSITGDAAMAILVECYYPYHQIVASTNTRLYLYDNAGGAGAASIGVLAIFTPSTALERMPVRVVRRLVPTAATHVYSIRGQTDGGTAIANAGAGGLGNSMPGFIRITRAA